MDVLFRKPFETISSAKDEMNVEIHIFIDH